MSYEYHQKGLCDRCEEKKAIWLVPFLYLDKNDKSHKDLGKSYRQYEICGNCKKSQERILRAQGKDDWNKMWERI